MTSFREWWRVMWSPQLKIFSARWDAELNELLDQFHFTEITQHTARLGPHMLWIENYPYCCFHAYRERTQEFAPRRKTIYRARMRLLEDMYRDETKEVDELEKLASL